MLLWGCLLGLFQAGSAQSNPSFLLSDDLQAALQDRDDDYFKIYLLLADQVDVAALKTEWEAARMPLEQRAPILLPLLQEKAAETQAPLLSDLRLMKGVKTESIRPLWIVNMVFLEADASAIGQLQKRTDLQQIGLDLPVFVHDIEANCEAAPAPPSPNGIEPGLAAINAPRMWREGYTGYGRMGYVIDTGQDPDHPALRNQFAYHNLPLEEVWAGSGEAGFCDSHGSHVAGTVLGLDRLNRDTIGVAFNANWMGGPSNLGGFSDCADNPDPTYQSTFFNLQWALNPDGDPATTDDIPDVINNSWGGGGSCSQSQSIYPNLFASYDALGIAVVFSAGNSGPGPSTVTAPGHLGIDNINIFTVGNINGNNPSFPINSGSSRGPSPCDGSIKPEVVAPGTNVRSAVPGGYSLFSGTSMASPHVAGAVLLLKEAFPALSGKALLNALYQSAVNLGPSGEDNTYGNGIIDVWAAYQFLVQEGNTPATPASTANDVILLDTDIPFVSCNGEVPIRLYVENGGQNTLTSLDVVFAYDLQGSNTSATQNWQGSIAPGQRAWIEVPSFAAPAINELEVRVALQNPNGQPDARTLNNALKSTIYVSEADVIPAATGLLTQACSGSAVLLQSGFDGEGTVRWYEEAEGGDPLAEGRTAILDVPENADEAIFYAETEAVRKVGLVDPVGNEDYDTDRIGLIFDCYSPFILKSVVVYAELAGNRLLRLERPDGSGTSFPVSVPGTGRQRIELDLLIEPGEGYQLEFQTGAPLLRVFGNGIGYPFIVPDVVNIRRGTGGGLFYNYFFDWEIEYLHPCGRSEVVVPVDINNDSPTAAFSASANPVDLADGGEVTFSDGSAGATGWNWDFGDGNTSADQNPTHTYTDVGSYLVSLTASNGAGCTDAVTSIVEVVNTTSTRDPNALDQFIRLYPNPTTGRVQVEIQKALTGQVSLRVVDMLGRQVLPERLIDSGKQTFSLNLQALAPGTYSVIVQSGEGRAVKRVLRM